MGDLRVRLLDHLGPGGLAVGRVMLPVLEGPLAPTTTVTVTVAGAGTGKTHALVERYLWALLGLDGAEPRGPERLLAITFTEKAAHEMRARLERRLADLRFAPERESSVFARAEAQGRTLDAAMLEGLRRSLSGAPIFTFHAFCARVLRDHALAAGLDPAFVVLEPDDERRLLEEIAEACVIDALQGVAPSTRKALAGGVSAPSQPAQQAVTAELVARVQLHGFGERKGLVQCLVALHGTLAERGLDARALPLAAAHADVDAALAQVAACVAALRPVASGQGAARTAAIEEQRSALVAMRLDPSIEDPEAAISHSFRTLAAHAGGNWGGPKVADERRKLVAAIDALGAALIDDMTSDLAPGVRALLAELDVRQRREKQARGTLAFGDLLLGARDLLRDVRAVRARVSARFERLFVDEYQDTSPVQEQILALLAGTASALEPASDVTSAAAPDGAPARLFVVGDPKQSIYGFRGADAQIFTRALDNAQREELTVSHRSTAPIVAIANLIATHALPRGAFGVERAQLVPLTSLRGGEGPAGEHWLAAVQGSAGGEAAVVLSPHERESLVVARRLRELIDAGEFEAKDTAILVRRGKAAVPIARALARVGIPAVVVGGDGFFVRPEVADVIAALTLAADPTDELAVLTVLRSPLVATPDDAILALYQQLPKLRGLTWPRVVEHAAAAAAATTDAVTGLVDRVRAFDAVLATVQQRLHQEPLGRAVDALLDDGNYAAACAVEPDAELRLRNLEKLRHLVARTGRSGRSESALVAVARLAASLDDPPPEPLAQSLIEAGERAAVRIMTIHQAKGLEFPVVVLADAGSGLKGDSDDTAFDPDVGLAVTARGRPIAACAQPSNRGSRPFAPTAIQAVRRRLRERNEGELSRLLYVAVTRARDRLFIVGTPRRAGPGSLLGMLELVRGLDTAAVDALLPRIEVAASIKGLQRPLTDTRADPALLEPLVPLPGAARAHEDQPRSLAPRLRLRASDLWGRLNAQTTMGFMQLDAAPSDDDERHHSRSDGALAHGMIALVATERAAALSDATALDAVLRRAARACGAVDAPRELLARCAVTLAGPVRRLIDAGFTLSFHESLWLLRDDVVVEGQPFLVARLHTAPTLVVELKLTAPRSKNDGAHLQGAAYAAALAQRGEQDVALATWLLGDPTPADAHTFGKAQRNKLDAALARLVVASA